ncbi:MAG TPA: hypothetical protein VKR21_04905 [Solirubrobacteraceae bacterium]|nr:hypothetical protein [Solirubrobacteraceae bacterium]
MGTGTSKPGLGLAALTLALAGCGGATRSQFTWLHPQAAPSAWRVAVIASGASMAYPPSWKRQRGDQGTATAALRAPDGRFIAYLNLTPRQGRESLSNWASFRPAHNSDEGDRDVRRVAAAGGLHFLSGHGSCVKDSYTTEVGARFVEIACLVVGPHTASVIVAAAPPGVWNRESPTLERAIEAVRT